MAKHELLGKRFGRLLVVAFFGRPPETNFPKVRPSTWLVRCDCGNEKIVRGYSLLRGATRSCGRGRCHRQNTKEEIERFRGIDNRTHGRTRTPEYRVWSSMKDRCTNPNNLAWKHYGGGGRRVCDR